MRSGHIYLRFRAPSVSCHTKTVALCGYKRNYWGTCPIDWKRFGARLTYRGISLLSRRRRTRTTGWHTCTAPRRPSPAMGDDHNKFNCAPTCQHFTAVCAVWVSETLTCRTGPHSRQLLGSRRRRKPTGPFAETELSRRNSTESHTVETTQVEQCTSSPRRT